MTEEPKRRLSKCYNKKTGVTYVYEVLENYWDKERHQARNKRRMIGKIDPATGEMIPTGKRGRTKNQGNKEHGSALSSVEQIDYRKLYAEMKHEVTKKEKELAGSRRRLLRGVQEALEEIEVIRKQLASLEQTTRALFEEFTGQK